MLLLRPHGDDLSDQRHKTRTVEISPRLADATNERKKHSKSECLFPNRYGRPDSHLLYKLQSIARRAEAKLLSCTNTPHSQPNAYQVLTKNLSDLTAVSKTALEHTVALL